MPLVLSRASWARLKFGRRIRRAVEARPDGLLLHEPIAFSPRQLGMRQYWRDFDALEAWARAPPHRQWWTEYLKNTGGTGFWHETCSMAGGIEAIYDNMDKPVGLLRFAPAEPAVRGMFSARHRLRRTAGAQEDTDAAGSEPGQGRRDTRASTDLAP